MRLWSQAAGYVGSRYPLAVFVIAKAMASLGLASKNLHHFPADCSVFANDELGNSKHSIPEAVNASFSPVAAIKRNFLPVDKTLFLYRSSLMYWHRSN